MSNYQRRVPFEVEAIRLIRPIFDEEGNRLADTGEWILTDGKEQYYMKDEDFQREFVRKGPQKEIVVQKEIQTQIKTYPVYIEKPTPIPCPQPWVIPWWERGIVWCDSHGYTSSHHEFKDNTVSNT